MEKSRGVFGEEYKLGDAEVNLLAKERRSFVCELRRKK